jgi:hypothetical protein
VVLSQIGPDSYGGKKSHKIMPDLKSSSIFWIFSPKNKNNYDVTQKVGGNKVASQFPQHPNLFSTIENNFYSKKS